LAQVARASSTIGLLIHGPHSGRSDAAATPRILASIAFDQVVYAFEPRALAVCLPRLSSAYMVDGTAC